MPSDCRKTLAFTLVMSLLLNVLPATAGRAEAQETQAVSPTSTSRPALSVPLPEIPDRSFDVTAYGAVGDGAKDAAAAIQAAIDAASAAGGGSVIIPSGTFLSGPISLASNLNLHLQEGAVLRMLPFGSYPEPSDGEYRPLMHGRGLHDVAITGPGTVEGQGQPWWDAFGEGSLKDKRPEMISLFRATRLAIQGVRLGNAPMAHIDIGKSADVTIDGVTIDAPDESPNTDGIDVWGTNIVIKNCSIASGDDHIAISGNTSNVSITHCKFGVGHGVSIGSSTKGGVNNVVVDNCQFDGSTNGFRGKSNRQKGGVVQNLSYSNITMTNVKYPIRFESVYNEKLRQAEQTQTQPATDLTPLWKNVTFTNITAQVRDKYGAGILWGLPEAPIENVTFKNVKITAYKGFKIYFSKGIVFSSDSQIHISGSSKPLLLYEAAVEAPESMTQGGPRPE
ncbi:MAG: glycoside hydrolase family 28 protein [Phycisphaerae bacterium]|nr:glycoside hydrolase family 28 protein [Phycisphaerae bacterium]